MKPRRGTELICVFGSSQSWLRIPIQLFSLPRTDLPTVHWHSGHSTTLTIRLPPSSRMCNLSLPPVALVFSKPPSLVTNPYSALGLVPAVHTRQSNWQSAEWGASRLLIATGFRSVMWFAILEEFHRLAVSK